MKQIRVDSIQNIPWNERLCSLGRQDLDEEYQLIPICNIYSEVEQCERFKQSWKIHLTDVVFFKINIIFFKDLSSYALSHSPDNFVHVPVIVLSYFD